MAEEFITRDEHEEFCRRMESENKRLEDENNRQNQRIKNLEKSTEQVQLITLGGVGRSPRKELGHIEDRDTRRCGRRHRWWDGRSDHQFYVGG